jgi:hypothetical protein
MTPEGLDNVDMCVYISLSINQKAIVLSPTRACDKIHLQSVSIIQNKKGNTWS